MNQLSAASRLEIRQIARSAALGRSYSQPSNKPLAQQVLEAYRWRVEELASLFIRRGIK